MILSIIIPTKNEEKHLPHLLRSIKKQTLPRADYEVIVADNKSTDKTREMALEYGSRITGGGLPAKGRNRGARAAKGEILLFLDADVRLADRNFLKKAIAEFKRRRLDVAVPEFYYTGQKSSSLGIIPSDKSSRGSSGRRTAILLQNLLVLLGGQNKLKNWIGVPENKMNRIFSDLWNHLVEVSQYISPYAGGWCIFATKKMHDRIKGFDEKIVLGEDSDYAKRAAGLGTFRMLKSTKVQVSPRRLKKEGYLKVAFQSMGTGLYWSMFGRDRKNIFNYKFDIYNKD